jgi:thiosulfate dehydrogenase [quinone] large subunit
MAILFLTLFTNQHFHGGVWGTLHNKSVKPKIEISEAEINNSTLSFQMYRVEGADVYGSFLIGIKLLDSKGDTVFELDQNALATFPQENIDNRYVAKIKSGKHSMVIPLGAKATLSVDDASLSVLGDGNYELMLTDISGASWSEIITKEQ